MKQRKQMVRRSGLLMAVLLMAAALLPAVRIEAASKKTVYVVTECRSKDGSEKYNYEYNSEGLVSRKITASGTMDYFYNSKGLLKKMVEKDEALDEDSTWTFSYDENNHMVKMVEKDNRTKKRLDSAVFTYSKKGRLSQIIETISKRGEVPRKVLTYKLNYKKGLLSKISITMDISSEKEVFEFQYNDRKNLSKQICSWGTATEKFTYNKNGRISKRTEKMVGADGGKATTVYTFKYKKVTVPKSRVPLINEQQSGFLGTRWSFFY